jgi:hypothetical protein
LTRLQRQTLTVANFVIVVNCDECSLAHFQEANCTNEQLKLNEVVSSAIYFLKLRQLSLDPSI